MQDACSRLNVECGREKKSAELLMGINSGEFSRLENRVMKLEVFPFISKKKHSGKKGRENGRHWMNV